MATTVANHLQKLHAEAARRSGAVRDILAKWEGRLRKSAEAHRALHRTTGATESGHSELAVSFDAMADDVGDLKKLFDADETFHYAAMVDVEKSAAPSDLSKGHNRDEDELNKLAPSQVSAINRGANALIPRTGTPVARTGTDNAVAPQLAKMMALDD